MASNNNSANTATTGGSAGAAKKGKMKGKTVELTEFLNKPINWAEEMEELSNTPADPDHSTGGDYSTTIEVRTEIIQKRSQLPTAPKAALSTSVDTTRVPKDPPFSAYVGNVSYDAREDDVTRFFHNLSVVNVRLMKADGRVKGYGYVEFETRDDLLKALAMDKQRLLNREVKIDLADRPDERGGQGQRGGYGSGRGGGRPQRNPSGYEPEKSHDSPSDWRLSRGNIGPLPTPYEDDRRSQPRSMGPPAHRGAYHPPPAQMGYGYPPQQQGYAPPPAYGPPHGYSRRPQMDEYHQYQRGPSGYDSDYTGGRGGYEGGYPVMRQSSYSSQVSGYASDHEVTRGMGGRYHRGQQGPGYYNSIRREYKGRQTGPPSSGGDRYDSGGDNYGAAPRYQQGEYNQPHYQEGYSSERENYGGRPQRSRGGYDNRRGGPSHRGQYSYDHQYAGGAGSRVEERMSSVDTTDGNDPAGNRPKERPKLALQPRTKPLPQPVVAPISDIIESHVGPPDQHQPEEQQEVQAASAVRIRTSVSSAEVFGGAKPVDTSAREREIEEKLRKEAEEFRRRQEEERKQQQQRKTSSSTIQPDRISTARRRTSDSQSSASGRLKSATDESVRHEDEDRSQVKILQRSRTLGSEISGDNGTEAAHQGEDYHRDFRPAPTPSQNAWAAQDRRRGAGPQGEQPDGEPVSDQVSSKSIPPSDEAEKDENGLPSNLSERHRGKNARSKSSDAGEQLPQSETHIEGEDMVFKPQQQRQPNQYGSQRGGRGGRSRGGQYHSHQYDQAGLPPRFTQNRRSSTHTDDGQENQYNENRRRSKGEIVIRRGGQGTLSPQTGVRRSGPGGQNRPPNNRPASRERDFQQRGNGRRPNPQQQYRRGSADSGLPPPPPPLPQEENPASQKPPKPARVQPPNASSSRKSSATPAVPDPPPVTFESKNKFEMLDMEDD